MPAVVCNASPLIVLAKVGLLDLLPRIFDAVFVPAAVSDEIAHGPADDPMRALLPRAVWLRRVRLDPPLSPLAGWQLGAGEAEVIEYARLNPPYGVILDDRAARRAAFAIGLKVYGTLSVLALGRRGGLLPSFRQAADSVVHAGLRVRTSLWRTSPGNLRSRVRESDTPRGHNRPEMTSELKRRDAADIFTATAGMGLGAKARWVQCMPGLCSTVGTSPERDRRQPDEASVPLGRWCLSALFRFGVGRRAAGNHRGNRDRR